MTTFTSGGITIAYDDIGPRDRGRPILLVHGFSSNRTENWRRVGWYGALERRHMRFVALDCRGHGESEKPHDATAYTSAKMVADIFALMDNLEIQRADLMGYSMGARLALHAASAQPQRVGDLILGGVGERIFDARPPGSPMADAMTMEHPDDIGDPLLRSFRQFAEDQGEDRFALAACARGGADSVFSRDDLAAVSAPTLVIAGARDDLAGDPDALASALRDGRSRTLPGCDHFSTIPHTLFKAAVFDFLDGELN